MTRAAAALLIVAASGGGDDEPVDPDAGDRSSTCVQQDEAVQDALDDARTSPVAMAAVRNEACGTTVYLSGDSEDADEASLWRIGSVTKTFVAGTVLSLIADGELGLDDPLSDHVADVAGSDGVTVRMLLAMRSGIFNYTNDPAFFADPTRAWTPREIVDFATGHGPAFAPDAMFGYSNTNYVLLGMIVEAITGEPVADAVHARAIDAAGLTRTFLDGPDAVPEDELATGYAGDGSDVTFSWHPSGAWTAGAMVASGADLVDWLHAYFATDAVLSEADRELIAISQAGYGLGVQFWPSNSNSGEGRGHTGAYFGFNTVAMYFPYVDAAIAVVVNQDTEDPGVAFQAVLDAAY